MLKKKLTGILLIICAFGFAFNYNVNAQNLKFMGVPMTTLKDFGDKIQQKITLNNPKPTVSGLTARIDEFAGVPSPTIDIIYNLSNVKNPNNPQDLNSAKIAHVVIDFNSMKYLGVSTEDEPDKDWISISEFLQQEYGKPTESKIKNPNGSTESGDSLKWKLKSGEIEFVWTAMGPKIIFTDKANSNLKTKSYIN